MNYILATIYSTLIEAAGMGGRLPLPASVKENHNAHRYFNQWNID